MGQTTTVSLDFPFEEVPLTIGTDRATGKSQRIALISGTCQVVGSVEAWDIDAITLHGPILHDPDVEIRWVRSCQTGHELWDWICTSITDARGDEIVTALMEA